LKSTLEAYHEMLIKKGFNGSDNQIKKLDSIVRFLRNNEKVNEQIMGTATVTIKTIQPSILPDDFKIAMAMVYSVVSNAIYHLAEDGSIEIKDKEVK